MNSASPICPYPGLRPFTEEESIFFKGRELHVRQIISQLEDKKIVMITGASGDGKSSLVYAGVIPNARAGFFRAKYNSWLIADFRPERSPLRGLSRALAPYFGLAFDEIEGRLRHGFSALIEMYKASRFFVDTRVADWEHVDEAAQRRRKREAANLFILADQFEEFFTNPENFNLGAASDEAYITVNLLLETARIALRDDLPVYVVCTMRSDFISQCVAFKGLPEAIGFSQFFVPRLKRNELQQVIEEPARLAGGSVSKRLSELVINELNEGFDQLPLLQHALNRLWKEAGNGAQELDLIHLARIAGINAEFLPDAERREFQRWRAMLDDERNVFYEAPGFTNILNTHANLLYLQAFSYFEEQAEWAPKGVSRQDGLRAIKVAFQSLTRIDAGRAVRNRMSLGEITRILNQEGISSEVVCALLNVFRLQDSTFIRPFISESDIESVYLSPSTILDITHEALIRNWQLLSQWVEEESKILEDYQDFSTQLERWLKSGRQSAYLLPIGPLSYFESWFEKSGISEYWLYKYSSASTDKESRLEACRLRLADIKALLKASRDEIIRKEKSRRRKRRFAFFVAVIVIVILAGFLSFALKAKSEAQEQTRIANERTRYANEQKAIAEAEKNKAIEANQRAEAEKLRAENSATLALEAKNESDFARQEALRMKSLAEKNLALANEAAETARLERDKAENQKQIAEGERKKALAASDSARKLSYLALAQSLSYQAKLKYDDPQVNLLLAAYAWHFNVKYNGSASDHNVYEALRFALSNSGAPNILIQSNEKLASIAPGSGNKPHVLSASGLLSAEGKNLQLSFKAPANQAFFLSGSYWLTGHEDKSIYWWDTGQKNSGTELKGHKDLLRAAAWIPALNLLATSARDQTIILWDMGGKRMKGKPFENQSIVRALCFDKTGTVLFSGDEAGAVRKWDIASASAQTLHTENSRVLSLLYDARNAQLFAGYASGVLRIIDPSNRSGQSILVSAVGIEHLAMSPSGKYLAVATADKTIFVYQIGKFSESPIVLTDHLQKVRSLVFDANDRLLALCRDNTVRSWEASPAALYEKTISHISRDLSREEWSTYIGVNFAKEKYR